MAQPDLDDRSVADVSKRTEFIPRAAATYIVQPLIFTDRESDSSAGWLLEFEILKASPTKTDELFDPCAAVGSKHVLHFNKISPRKGRAKIELGEMRTFLASLMGQEHTPEFKANKVLTKALKLGDDLSGLNPLKLSVDAWRSKPVTQDDGTEKIFINTSNYFHPLTETELEDFEE